MHQALSAISQRKRRDAKIRRSELTWQTTVLAQYVVASGSIEEKDKLLDSLSDLSMEPKPKKAPAIRDIETVRQEAADRNGSFMRVATSFKKAGSFTK